MDKLGKYSFIGVPLTSKKHDGNWYVPFTFQNKNEYAVIAQVENISTYRLHYKMGEVPEIDLDKVIIGLVNLLTHKISPNLTTRTGGYPRKFRYVIAQIMGIVKKFLA